MRVLLSLILVPMLSGCVVASVADAAVDIVTLPVDVAAKGVDLATTSQAEADQNRGREIRKAEEKAGKEARAREKRCRDGRPLPADDCSVFRSN
jgi:hypothetical protein